MAITKSGIAVVVRCLISAFIYDAMYINKIEDVSRKLKALGVKDEDLREEFIKGSGSGGQKINKTNSCVQLTYLKKGWVIRCQKTRSREQNRFFAKRLLLEKLEAAVFWKKSEKEKQIHKIRVQKRKRSKRAKEKLLDQKKKRSDTKKLRQRPQNVL